MAIQASNEMANSLEHTVQDLSLKLEQSKAEDRQGENKCTPPAQDAGDNPNDDLECSTQALEENIEDLGQDSLQNESIDSPSDDEAVHGNAQAHQPDALKAKEQDIRDLEDEIVRLTKSLEVGF